MERLVEICCGSYEDALNAYHGGAKRIELNSALHLGGLTPTLASLKMTKKNTDLKVITIYIKKKGDLYLKIHWNICRERKSIMPVISENLWNI